MSSRPQPTAPRSSLTGGRGSVVPTAEPRSYYDQPVIKPPVWTWEIPTYFFLGGMAGASSVMALAAEAVGNDPLSRTGRRLAAAGAIASPLLLISDLGKPARFHHMMRVVKPTSPMSVGSWILALYGPAAVSAAGLAELGRLPRLRRLAGMAAAGLGPALSTYTAVLIGNTAVPVWQGARHALPAVFAAGSIASTGAVATLVDPDDVLARRLALVGGIVEIVAARRMERQLGTAEGRPLHEGASGILTMVAKATTIVGTALLAYGNRRHRSAAVAGAALVLAGTVAERWAVFKAGFASARDPRATVEPQRRRLDEGRDGQISGVL